MLTTKKQRRHLKTHAIVQGSWHVGFFGSIKVLPVTISFNDYIPEWVGVTIGLAIAVWFVGKKVFKVF